MPPPSSAAEARSEDGSTGSPEFGDHVDYAAFEQILEMDDDEEERDFSKGIVYDFFTQAEEKFGEMDAALEKKDLPTLSQLGHFLKGSSATLGLTKVKDHCEIIQHLGAMKSEDGNTDETDREKCLKKIRERVAMAKTDFHDVEKLLKKFFHDEGSS